MQVHPGSYTTCVTDVDIPQQLRELRSSLESAIRSVIVAQNELSLISKLPPETLTTISEFVAEPRSQKSTLEIVKLTHVCRYWRSTLISLPHLWSSIFVTHVHPDFLAACLERSREVPLAVHLDLKYGDYSDYSDLLEEVDCIQRIRKLDVHFTVLCDSESEDYITNAFCAFRILTLPLPILENLSFCICHDLDGTHMEFPIELFCWRSSPPTKLRHLTLYNCYGGPIQALSNLTSLELSGDVISFNPMILDQHTFLPLISNNPSLVSLHLSRCSCPDRAQLSQVTPVKLSKLKSLRLMDIRGLPGFPSLVEVPAFKVLSALWISTRKRFVYWHYDVVPEFLVRAESDDGFQLSYNAQRDDHITSDWLAVMCDANPSPAVVRFEGKLDLREDRMKVSPLPLFANAKILEIGASFASPWYRDFWKDLEKVGPQLNTLRLEVTEGTSPAVVESVKEFAKARFQNGMPLKKLERMASEGMNEEGEEKAKRLWEEFRAGLDIDQYLIAQ